VGPPADISTLREMPPWEGGRTVKDGQLPAAFDKAYLRTEKSDYFESLKLFEEMWMEGIQLGVLPLKDPLEGIEVDIRIAKILNHIDGIGPIY